MRLPTLFTLIDFIKEWKNAWDKSKKDKPGSYQKEGFKSMGHDYNNPQTFFSTRPKVIGNQNECGPMCENLISAGLSAEENLMSDWVLRYKRERFINKEKPRVQIFANGRDITDQCSIADDYGMITVVYKGDGIL